MEKVTKELIPIVPLRNAVILPGTSLPLNIGRPRSINAVDRSILNNKFIVTIAQKSDNEGVEPSREDLYHYGTLCKIEQVRGNSTEGYQLLVRGMARMRVDEIVEAEEIFLARGEVVEDFPGADEKTVAALTSNIKQLAKEILALVPADTRQAAILIDAIDDPSLLIHLCTEHLEAPLEQKQKILETASIRDRALRLLEMMQDQKEALQIQSEIREKLSHRMGKHQRETLLREQLKTIREELGDDGEGPSFDDYLSKIEAAEMPDEVKKVALDEAKRLSSIGNASPESHVIRNYLDLLCAMPWNKAAAEDIDLDHARASLEEDHFGLEKVKKRIIQHLAVMKLRKTGKGPILLLVGPPGVGKTSLGQSVAKALGRKFVRTSLGGVRDEAEIRGHRRTYVGAMPGRVIQGIKRAGENNPVMMLDEIDKVTRGYNGDPSSALLEVLDPEQNKTFSDHYLDVPFDLSKVFFIATANSLETIPGPLLDRMEVIDLSGYTTAEKLHIAKNHLLPKQLEEHGMTAKDLEVKDAALMRVITHYTREAGVRTLQRQIATLCRGTTEKVLAANVELPIVIDVDGVEEFLGPEKFVYEVAERISPPGVVTGLAWTPMGGEILFIEARLMPGTGKLTMTGQLGEVMKESAQIALSLVRSSLPALVPGFEFEKKDIHVHVPAGAIPKDGPSAGITMLTTFASLFSGRSVSPKLAMTGEVTLRGAVMPVGGIKEKVIAAHRAGIETIILSKRNEKDLREVPEEVRRDLKFEFAETVSEVLKSALNFDVNSFDALRPTNPPRLPSSAAS